MLRIEKILAPVDLSGASGVSLGCAGALARNFHSCLTVLHVGAAPESFGRLGALARAELGSLPFTAQVLPGDPARVIVDASNSGHFDLIAMATHGYGPFRRLLLGSVTTRVLDEAQCPVFTGAHLDDPARGCPAAFVNIVCAIDLTPKSDAVARWAADFCAAAGGRLFLVHVVPGLGAMPEDYFRPDCEVEPAHRAYEDLKALRDNLGIEAHLIVAGGEISGAIARQASELRADVLIAGRGAPGGRLGRLRSEACRIIRESPCPVITI